MSNPTQLDPVPQWATPDAWAEADLIVANAARLYEQIVKGLAPEEHGRYIAIDSNNAERFVLGDTEIEADAKFRANYGAASKAALFQIGYV